MKESDFEEKKKILKELQESLKGVPGEEAGPIVWKVLQKWPPYLDATSEMTDHERHVNSVLQGKKRGEEGVIEDKIAEKELIWDLFTFYFLVVISGCMIWAFHEFDVIKPLKWTVMFPLLGCLYLLFCFFSNAYRSANNFFAEYEKLAENEKLISRKRSVHIASSVPKSLHKFVSLLFASMFCAVHLFFILKPLSSRRVLIE